MAEAKSGQIVNVMKEERLFPPSAEFAAKARIKSMEQYEKMWKEAAGDIEGFWGKMAGELHWFKPYTKVLEWNEPFAKWFVGGQTNVSYNCLDVHLGTPAAEQGRRSSGRASRATSASHLPDAAHARSASSPTCSRSWASARATWSPCTCP